MAHILFITPFYSPEKGAAAVRVSETAERLVKRGHQVTVLTTLPNYPTGIVPPEYRGRVIQQEVIHEVRVVRIWSYITSNKSFLHRIMAQFSFGCLAALFGWRAVGSLDVIIVESHPLFNAISGRILAWRKHCPFIFMVSDLWPESAIQLGVLHNPVLIWLSKWLEWSTYKRASLVWALSEGIRDALIRGGLHPKHVFLVTNGADINKFRPMPKKQARTELEWDNRFTVLYAGTYGLSHGLSTVLDAAEKLRNRTDIHFVLVGDGTMKEDLIAQAQRQNLLNVTFWGPQQHDRMPLVLAGSDVCLVPMRKLPLFEGRLPLKMFEVMACARPFLLGVEGEARRLAVQNAGAAIYVEPDNAEALVSGILYLQEHPEERELLGKRGRAYVEAHFNRDHLTVELDARIEKLLDKRKVPISIEKKSVLDSEQGTPEPVSASVKEKIGGPARTR
jgi:glycosyltransferase involved in cell wall biosynthesis